MVNQAVDLYASVLEQDAALTHSFADGHSGWIQIVDGTVKVNGETLNAGDGAAIEQTVTLEIRALTNAELLLFDMA